MAADFTLAGIKARIRRLHQLSKGLNREYYHMRCELGALTFAEYLEYMQAIREALAGVEAARVALVVAVWRIEDEEAERARCDRARRR